MKQANSLSLVRRHDGSYFYIIELGLSRGLQKYMLADWQGSNLSKPIIIYSHTKRSNLSNLDKEYFDNNLLNSKRLDRYINEENNLYIGGIERIAGQPSRQYKEGIIIRKNFQVYIRNNNYILIELLSKNELQSYNINEFINRKTIIDFETNTIYTEKDLLNMNDETDYVINQLLKKERVEEKVSTSGGYVGTITQINGQYKKVSDEMNVKKAKLLQSN